MFQGCFTYNKKGPCHIWKDETAAEKKEAIEFIQKQNEEHEAKHKAKWELNTAIARIGIQRNRGSRKLVWKHTTKNRAMTQSGQKGGIDQWRYQKHILKAKLIPFAKKMKLLQPDTIVQEDKAPTYASKWQAPFFSFYKVLRLLWPGNSPDLNMIKPCQMWIKRRTTKRGAPSIRRTAETVQKKCQKDLPQKQIQAQIKRIPRHIKEVIRLEGRNEYQEGREDPVYGPQRPQINSFH